MKLLIKDRLFRDIPKVLNLSNENCYLIPKELFNEYYQNLSLGAKMLYGIYLDKLISEDVLKDEEGFLFFEFTIEEMNEALSVSTITSLKYKKELLKNDLLIQKDKKDKKSQNIYYLLKPNGM
ncbi:replication initiator protein A [Parvimonas sp. KA00067]|mgnify:CR=1 FL=1|uniref:Replication initiator protein A n=1 Tax=Parvimonas parva TaxID=2769485 RepID=A0ABS1C9N4_9FIRM|nr:MULTISPECIES: replication initiator protein A [Parvimonas]KXB66413.1 replication initiator protein A [Parvimonas sp. KA00067]MBK1468135.1 replication initiator protein A [Parvimonas parva]